MIPTEVARRYARALFEIGLENGALDALTQDLGSLAEAYEISRELRTALEDPLVALEAKRTILTEIANGVGAGVVAKHTLLLLGDRRRVRALPAIARALRELSDAHRGVVRAQVATARTLTAAQTEQLKTQLERITGKHIAIDASVDQALIAGVVARIGDTIYDGSLRGRMSQLRSQLLPN
jgi:F-type H+-transporting ATPase subunit delta